MSFIPTTASRGDHAHPFYYEPAPEVWRSVPGYGLLEASSHGRLRNGLTGHVLKLRLNNSGYLQTGFTVDGRWRTANAHRMVCLAFHGLPPHADWHAAHKDSDRTHNHADNMEWQSPQENCSDPVRVYRYKLSAEKRKADGLANPKPLSGYAKRRAEGKARGEALKAAASRDHARILSLFNEGQTVQQIATAIGRAYATVKRVITLSGSMTGAAQLQMAERLAA
ncbi:NUMOD4 domain protein [Rhizobium leguminosarum bv. trifolii WSM2304]|uniref:NUMOD4 domain protein n=1 Tax=Rhizobium leguminosarum bv. trifolii (strain WSM2304) TaxID=395492 RepID=A0ABF7QTT1_RHILW|nr:NUMOD4 domain-containing protein [Rhizobium leguminosarum]ACI57501.1 NUMOD4 domain protein [Rhizobium leguminosarum bv. trifolii WSM2304]